MKQLLACFAVLLFFFAAAPVKADHKTIYNTTYPASIRVAIRESRPNGEPNPRGRILYVKSVPFDNYVIDSLPNEWIPSWQQESLQAGAMAVKMFSWYKVLHPVKIDGWEFDLDNTTNFQTYREGNRFEGTSMAHRRVRNLAFTMPDGTIVELNYRAGYQGGPNWEYRNQNMMSQWGSQYWANEGRNMLGILQYFYQGRALHRVPGL
jgi:peptidoglycan hydrolase-like amidase